MVLAEFTCTVKSRNYCCFNGRVDPGLVPLRSNYKNIIYLTDLFLMRLTHAAHIPCLLIPKMRSLGNYLNSFSSFFFLCVIWNNLSALLIASVLSLLKNID